jgi:octaprenyl-diphosphate synthase
MENYNLGMGTMSADMQQLNSIIRADLNSDVVLIRQISEYIINGGGKRIRPLLCLLCGKIAGYTDGALLHKMAAMIEYIHTATLLHDDVVDESGLRRGYKTANAVFGNSASVLVGDFIYTRAFQMMVESNSLRILKIMADSTNKISEGEVLQLLNIGRSDLSEAEYFEVIKYKTATLFEAAATVATIIAGGTPQVETTLANYAINLGNAFQIADDVLDYIGNSNDMGKNMGDDLQEGKVTLPLIYLLQHGSTTEKNLIKNAIEKPAEADINYIVGLINNSNAINYCQQIAHKFVNNAVNCLEIFPKSEYKTAMIELAHSSINRIS